MNGTTVLLYNKATNQRQQLLSCFSEGMTITSVGALEMYGIGNLKARIFDLRESGHIITTIMTPFKTRLGKIGRHAIYHYVRFDENYIKPEKINNKLMLDLTKKYVIAKSQQMEAVYDSRYAAGKVTEASRDAMIKRHKDLISFVQGLK